MKRLTVSLALILSAACAGTKPSQVMVNPDTGDAKMVSTHSWGYGMAGVAAAVGAQAAQKDKVETLKEAGYVEIEKVATSGFLLASNDPLSKPVIGVVKPNGPAANAGIKTGDVITHRNGVEIKTVGDLKSQPKPNIGDATEWRVMRDGKNISFTTVAVSASQLLKKK